jgi:hypothetical protein
MMWLQLWNMKCLVECKESINNWSKDGLPCCWMPFHSAESNIHSIELTSFHSTELRHQYLAGPVQIQESLQMLSQIGAVQFICDLVKGWFVRIGLCVYSELQPMWLTCALVRSLCSLKFDRILRKWLHLDPHIQISLLISDVFPNSNTGSVHSAKRAGTYIDSYFIYS